VAAGERAAAQEWYGKGLAIRERLAALNPADVQAQRDLSVSYNKMGDLAVAAGERAAAQEWYGKALAIAERLAALVPESLQFADDLAIYCIKLAFARAEQSAEEMQMDVQRVKLLRRAMDVLTPFIASGRAMPRTQQIFDFVKSALGGE
jgi:tetratricopeptide (TPR) repeat protein